MINRLSNPINRNRSAAKISKVMSSSNIPFRQGSSHPDEKREQLYVKKKCVLGDHLLVVMIVYTQTAK